MPRTPSTDGADDVGATRANLFVDGVLASSDDSQPFGPWPVVDAPDGSHGSVEVELFPLKEYLDRLKSRIGQVAV